MGECGIRLCSGRNDVGYEVGGCGRGGAVCAASPNIRNE